MLDVVLEDVERIEVLRGSNSAAYGANALLGVINIVTRHTADSLGTVASFTAGGVGVKDNLLRHGWGTQGAHFRLTAERQTDEGYRNANDDKILSKLHFRSDLRPTQQDDLMLSAGILRHSSGEGFASNVGNPLRTVVAENINLHGVWNRQLAVDGKLRLSVSYDEENIQDRTPYAPLPGVMLDYGGRGRRWNAELQHTVALAPSLRMVWGAAAKREEAESIPLYHVQKVMFDRYQLFGNFEWRPHERWVVNAGGLWEKHSISGLEFAPRLAANFRVAPGHTLRAGVTRAFRSPSLFELKSDVRYYMGTTQVGRTSVARGGAQAETVDARELGYLAELPRQRMTLDVRAFEERIDDIIRPGEYELLPALLATGTKANDYINRVGYRIRGIEYQVRWKPTDGTEVWFNQAFLKTLETYREQDSMNVPSHIASLALFQRLSGGVEITAILYAVDSMSHRHALNDLIEDSRRLDLRITYPFRVGSTRVEAAVTVQAANGSYPTYLPSRNFEFDRRTYGTLRFEF
jgi:iron complex outermembrane receptor protein